MHNNTTSIHHILVLPLVDSGNPLEVIQPVSKTPLAAEGLGRND